MSMHEVGTVDRVENVGDDESEDGETRRFDERISQKDSVFRGGEDVVRVCSLT
jgi:hypothetical protein